MAGSQYGSYLAQFGFGFAQILTPGAFGNDNDGYLVGAVALDVCAHFDLPVLLTELLDELPDLLAGDATKVSCHSHYYIRSMARLDVDKASFQGLVL
jgi:hypothetical protein